MNSFTAGRVLPALISLLIASAIWLPLMHVFYTPGDALLPQPAGITPHAAQILNFQQRIDRAKSPEFGVMRAANPEWDLMQRTYLVLSLANAAKRDPGRAGDDLKRIDDLIGQTLRDESAYGKFYFLMPYARRSPFVDNTQRSLFLDSEIAMMIAVRRIVADQPSYHDEVTRRIASMIERMERGRVLCAESYPDECWLFDHTMALAAIRMTDVSDGTDHSEFARRWVRNARAHLIDEKTGLLVSSFSLDGEARDGPEGSSIWMAAHLLQLVDPEFAADQYARAKHELGGRFLGFGYAREWPAAERGSTDIDSGPVVPILGISTSSSGLECVAAAAFRDMETLRGVYATVEFGGFPIVEGDALHYAASNSLGDAVLLYSHVVGPIWDAARPQGAP